MKIYIMKCEHCGAPISDNISVCPYCGQKNTAEAIIEDENLIVEDGKMTIKKGGHLDIGNTRSTNETRTCPFCGDTVKSTIKECPSCGNKLIIEVLRVEGKLVLEGSLNIGSGGMLVVGSYSDQEKALIKVIKIGALDIVKRLMNLGTDPNFLDSKGKSPLFVALSNKHVEIAKYLISMGAKPGKKRKKIMAMAQKLDSPELMEALKVM